MRIGLNFFPDCIPESKTAEVYFRESLDIVERAEALGYDHIRIVEHYLSPYGGYSPNPIVFLAAAAQRTKRARLVTGCVIPAFSHPIKQAAELAMLDAISGGRLDVGVARAFLPHEYQAFGIAMAESRLRFNEAVEAMLELWQDRQVSFEGPFHRFENVRLFPQPVQQPHPPVWIAATTSLESFQWTGEKGFNLMVVPYLADFEDLAGKIDTYRRAYRAAGHGAGGGKIMISGHMYVHSDRASALAVGRAGIEHYTRVFLDTARAWAQTAADTYRGYEDLPRQLERLTFERVMAEGRAWIGTPEDVAQGIEETLERFGMGELSLQVNFGMMDEHACRESVGLFAREVRPALERWSDARQPSHAG